MKHFSALVVRMRRTYVVLEKVVGLPLRWRRKASGGAMLKDGGGRYVEGSSRHLPWETAWDSEGKAQWWGSHL